MLTSLENVDLDLEEKAVSLDVKFANDNLEL